MIKKYYLVFGVLAICLLGLGLSSVKNVSAQHSSYSDSYSDNTYNNPYSNTYSNSGTPPINRPPDAFGQNAPQVLCSGANDPKINISWTMAWGATSYRVYYLDSSVGTMQPAYPNGYNPGSSGSGPLRAFTFAPGSPLIVGHSYGFVIEAVNAYGSTWSNNPPYSPAVPGGWGHSIYGWTVYPDCSPPGPFTFSQAPAPSCTGVSASRIEVRWTPSSYATSYGINPQSNIRGWFYNIPATSFDGSGGYFNHVIPTPIPPNEGWEYTVWASNAYGYATANNSSTYYVYGNFWAPVYNCDNPIIDLKIDGTDVIKTINNGSSITLNYSASNAYTLTTSSNRVVAPTAIWRNLYPSNNAVSNPWSTSGAVSLTLYNNATYPFSSYQFTLQGVNNKLSGSPSQSKTVTVNVLPDMPPFIQTTQGDVHSNSNINVPN